MMIILKINVKKLEKCLFLFGNKLMEKILKLFILMKFNLKLDL